MTANDRTPERPWISSREVPNGWTLRPADDGTEQQADGRQVPQKVR